jgi:hypothetical protein
MFLSHVGGMPGLINQVTTLTPAVHKAPAVTTTVKTSATVLPPSKPVDKKTSTTPPPPPPVKPLPDKIRKSKLDGPDNNHGKGNG